MLWNKGLQIFIPARREYVHDNRIFQRLCLMLDPSPHHEAVSRAHRKRLAADRDRKLPAHHKGNLIVRMLMPSSDPSFLHPMLGKKQFLIVGAHAAQQSWLGRVDGCIG